jgi:hypothetical protein
MIVRERVSRTLWMIGPSLLLLLGCGWNTRAQTRCSEVATDEHYIVREVKVNTLFGGAPPELKEALAAHRGEKYSADDEGGRQITRDVYRAEVKDFFAKGETAVNQDRRAGINQQNALYVRFKLIDDCVIRVPVPECQTSPNLKDEQGHPIDKCLDIKIKIKVVPINTGSLSANLLDLARSNKLRFYRELPKGLRTFNPSFWVDYDRDYGATAVVNSTIDMLELATPEDETNPARNTQLHLSVDARKSLQKRFYDTTSVLTLARTRPLKPVSGLGLSASFSASEQPQGDGLRLINSARIGGNAIVNMARGPFSKLGLGANYRRASNRLYAGAGVLAEHSAENAFESRAFLDGEIARGFVRGAIWFDGASRASGSHGSYQRVATMVGYARELVWPEQKCHVVKTADDQEKCEFSSTNAPALGLEMLFGAGHAWGSVPEYARFYGGNSSGNFLYDAVNEAAPVVMPNGPLIRSFGRNRVGTRGALNDLRGGTAYWHYNLSVAIPLKKLSRPLIPAEVVIGGDPGSQGECHDCASLKSVLKEQVKGEKFIFIDAMALRAMTPQQREDLALDDDDPANPLTTEEKARLAAADEVFKDKQQAVTPEAEKVWKRLTPTIEYIADHANLYAIRPLMMFDAARITARDSPSQRTRLAFGGGIQFNVVVAKFEIGYVRTVRRIAGDQKGNFVVRMLFEKLF